MKSHFAFLISVYGWFFGGVFVGFFFYLNFNSKLCYIKYSVEKKSEQSAERNKKKVLFLKWGHL